MQEYKALPPMPEQQREDIDTNRNERCACRATFRNNLARPVLSVGIKAQAPSACLAHRLVEDGVALPLD